MPELAILFIITVLIITLMLLILLRKKRNEKIINTITNIFKEHHIDFEMKEHPDLDLIIETIDTVYLIKVIKVPSYKEIIITNKTTWLLHNKGQSQTHKNDFLKVKPFIDLEIKTEKTIKKIFVIYPNIHNVLKYINESDMIIVNESSIVYGYKVFIYEHIRESFKKEFICSN